MANPTWAEAWDQTKNRINLFQKLHLFANNNSPNWLGLQDTLEQSLEGEYLSDVITSVKADRSALSSILAPENVRSALTPHLLEIARAAAIPERDVELILPRLRDYMHSNSYSVNGRDINFGSPSADGSNTGNGLIHRLTVDENGYELEGVFLEAKRAEVLLDQGQVDKHEEVLEFRGVEAEQDFLNVLGSGMRVPVVALHAGGNSTGRFLQNPSFEDFTGTAPTASTPTTLTATDEVTGWTVTTAANAAVELDTTYRGYPAQPTNLYSLRFTNNNKIVQTVNNTVRPVFDPLVPMYCQVAIYRASTATGNVTLRFGASSKTVALTSLTDNAWNIVKIDVGTGNWYKNFREGDLTVEVELDTYGGAGHIKIDDLIVGPYTNVDGTWYVVVGGSTAFKQDDFFTWTDALTLAEGIIAYWFWRAGFGYLVTHQSGLETITDPA